MGENNDIGGDQSEVRMGRIENANQNSSRVNRQMMENSVVEFNRVNFS